MNKSEDQNIPPVRPFISRRMIRPLWTFAVVTLLGCGVGILSLALTVNASSALARGEIFLSYFTQPRLLALNLWPPLALVWGVYLLTGRAWAGFLCGSLPVVGLSLVGFFKIQLRGDPLIATDLGLAPEALKIVGRYELTLTGVVWLTMVCLVLGLAAALFAAPRCGLGRPERLLGGLSALALLAVSVPAVYFDVPMYEHSGDVAFTDTWNATQRYVARGSVYPFLHSGRELAGGYESGYDENETSLLAMYTDADIPEEKKVSVLGIMLEAFCDLTDFPALAEQDSVVQIYAPWHELVEESVSGRLLTNVFSAGTVDTEWAFLTGYTTHGEFVKNTDSYVWYFDGQGYQTFGSHPGFGWFYDRQDINPYLGFQEYWFTENHYGELVDPVGAQWYSDHILVQELLDQLGERIQDGPCFSFSVSYQNHGPYEWTHYVKEEYLIPEESGLPEETCYVFSNYLRGIADTISALTELADGLKDMDEPVVLVLFGDHKPWGGSSNEAYFGLGVDFSLTTTQSVYDYYATPYLIWANPAAKEILGDNFSGAGGDFSPCFLMPKLFDLCGWEGPAFMQLSRQLRDMTPLVHANGLYIQNGEVTDSLSDQQQAYLERFLAAQYGREQGTPEDGQL